MRESRGKAGEMGQQLDGHSSLTLSEGTREGGVGGSIPDASSAKPSGSPQAKIGHHMRPMSPRSRPAIGIPAMFGSQLGVWLGTNMAWISKRGSWGLGHLCSL